MKISILGSNGFLSTAIARYANQQGWELDVYGLDTPTTHKFNHFYQTDLVKEVMDCSALLDSDMIVYAIGAGIQSNLKESNDLVYHLNVTVPVAICNRLKELGFQGVLVSFGSFFEIGESSIDRPFTEDEVLLTKADAPNDYTVSKRMFSRFVSSYRHQFTHWHFILPTIYGEGENPKRLIPYTINAIKNDDILQFTSGEQIRQYIYVGEIPPMLEKAQRLVLPSGLYNVEGPETNSVKEIVSEIFHAFGKEVPDNCFGKAERTDIGMKYLALDGKKLKEAIGFSSSVRILDVIKNYMHDGV